MLKTCHKLKHRLSWIFAKEIQHKTKCPNSLKLFLNIHDHLFLSDLNPLDALRNLGWRCEHRIHEEFIIYDARKHYIRFECMTMTWGILYEKIYCQKRPLKLKLNQCFAHGSFGLRVNRMIIDIEAGHLNVFLIKKVQNCEKKNYLSICAERSRIGSQFEKKCPISKGY